MQRFFALLLCTLMVMGTLTSCLFQKIEEETEMAVVVTTPADESKEEHTHSYVQSTVAPTCTEKGYTEYTCTCGDSYKSNETPSIGHSYSSVELEDGTVEFTCKNCGDTYIEGEPTEVEEETTAPPDTSTTAPENGEEEEIPVIPGTEMFDGVAFIGDSISLKLQYYHAKTKALGAATFLCQGSYSVNHAVNGTMLLAYGGKNMAPQDALKACGAKKVFILLGMNDIALVGIDKTIENWGVLIGRIREKCPDIEITIQAETPIFIGGEKGGLNNANVDKYNTALKAFAAENGLGFLDVCTPMKDAAGGLKAEYCSDSFVHFTDAACEKWTAILKAYLS